MGNRHGHGEESIRRMVELAAERGYVWEDGTPVRSSDYVELDPEVWEYLRDTADLAGGCYEAVEQCGIWSAPTPPRPGEPGCRVCGRAIRRPEELYRPGAGAPVCDRCLEEVLRDVREAARRAGLERPDEAAEWIRRGAASGDAAAALDELLDWRVLRIRWSWDPEAGRPRREEDARAETAPGGGRMSRCYALGWGDTPSGWDATPGIPLDEEGRLRLRGESPEGRPVFAPLPEGAAVEDGRLVAVPGPEDVAVLLVPACPGYRGSSGVEHVAGPEPVRVARAFYRRSPAGSLGSGEEVLLALRPGSVLRLVRSGRRVEVPSLRIEWDGTRFALTDERAEAREAEARRAWDALADEE